MANKRGDSIVVDGVMRLDRVDGKWVACDWWAGAIGDNIDLVRYVEPGTNFPDAVFRLTGAREDIPTRIAPVREKPQDIRRPSIPYERGAGAGRAYLRDERMISPDTIRHAETSGMVRYLDNGILITGRDASRAIRSATLRHIEPVRLDDGSVLTKRDLADSDKTYPAVLPGSSARLVVTEGGVNAMAIRDMAIRAGEEPPTIIATGGVGVRRWVSDNPELRQLVERADHVVIMAERESTPAKQIETDARRQQLARLIAEARQGEVPDVTLPPPGVKDVADWNAQQQLEPDPTAAALHEPDDPNPEWR